MAIRPTHLLLVLALAAPLAFAQSPAQPATSPACATPALATFDVATIKPSDQPSGSSHFGGTTDTLSAGGTVRRMLQYAYNVQDFQISGGPAWLGSETWEVLAKVEQPPPRWSALSGRERGAVESERMRAVLTARFHLQCHFETKELPLYNLVLAKGGPKPALAPTPPDSKSKGNFSNNGRNRAYRMEATGVPIDSLASNLVWFLGRQVIDKTGLSGLYTFTLNYISDPDAGSSATADEPSGPTIFTALEEQLGLKLESAKGPVPILVIDSISRPSEN
ncbi:MAG TPA: TIGR03435 family protein [Acidobacteriaceae bacterium]|nr:TIGR03435 family protein [Acidobacteriaceae bacterium]